MAYYYICLLTISVVYVVCSSEVIKDANVLPLCSLGIQRFSSKISQRHFYECGDDAGAAASLVECPLETVYNTKKQKCMTRYQESKDDMPIDEKTLGRNVHLGSMFIAKSNTFDTFHSPWNQDTIDQHAEKYDKREVHTEFTADKKVKEKISHMDISAELAGDFLSGLVQAHGAASYLSDTVDRDNEVNVEMKFHTTKYVRTISQFVKKDHEELCSSDSIEKFGFTHVVTSVTYGMDAIFVFKYVLSDHESESHITGELDFAIHSIPSFGISGKADVDLSDSQTNIMQTTTISLFGDFSMDNVTAPTTFNTTVDFYKKLPTFAGQDPDWKGTKILNVHMTPLKWICSGADVILNAISESLMGLLMDMLDELDQLRLKVGGLIHSDPAQKFPATIKKNLGTYDSALEQFKSGVTGDLQKLLPNIRGGDGDGEEDLLDLIQRYKESQFEYELSTEFLAYRHREIAAIKIVLSNYPTAANTLVCDFEDATCVDIILHHEYVVTLELNVISPPSFTNDFLNGNFRNESELWFNQVTLNGQLGGLIRNFANFAAENVSPEDDPAESKKFYIIKLQELDQDLPWTIKARSYGKPISDNEFEVPMAPQPPSQYDITFEGFKFEIEKPSEFVFGFKVYTVDILANQTVMEHPDVDFPEDLNPGDLFEVKVSGLDTASPYTFMVRYKTEVGVAPYSQQSQQFLTAPSSPPRDLTVDEVATNYIKVSWSEPANVGIPEDDAEYLVSISGEDGYVGEIATAWEKLDAVFEVLTDATSYTLSVRAITWVAIETGNDTVVDISQSSIEISQSPEATVASYTSPLPPTMLPPIPGEIGLHQVTARWEPPTNLGTGVTLDKYIVGMDDGDVTTFEETTDTNMEFKGLKEGQLYNFACQIVTSEGQSLFSGSISIQTLSDESAMDKFKKELADTFIRPIIYEAELEMTRESSVCGYRDVLATPGGGDGDIVTYEEVYLEKNDFTNQPLLVDGMFEVPVPGIYQVNYKVGAANLVKGNGQHVFKVVKNSDEVTESQAMLQVEDSDASIPVSGSLLVEAGPGDWLMLMHQTINNPGTADHVSFCVHLVQETQ